eukprot:6571652-Pyramimonas_sp.AAC.1
MPPSLGGWKLDDGNKGEWCNSLLPLNSDFNHDASYRLVPSFCKPIRTPAPHVSTASVCRHREYIPPPLLR